MIFYKVLTSSEFFCFLCGLTLSITNITYRYSRKKWKLFKFKRLIIKTYINPVKSLESEDIGKFTDVINDYTQKLSDLKTNELVYNNCDYQFELIRMIEYVKAVFAECLNQLDIYGVRNTSDDSGSYNPENKERISQMKNYLRKCIKNITKYYKLKIDNIPEYLNQ